MEQDNTLKMDATKTPAPRSLTVKDVPPGKVFRTRSGTHYIKMSDGSLRNIDKVFRKEMKKAKKAFRKLGLAADETNAKLREFAIKFQEAQAAGQIK